MSITARINPIRLLAWISTAWFGMLVCVALLAMIDYGANHAEYSFPQEGRGWAYRSLGNQIVSQLLVFGYGVLGLFICRWARQSFNWVRVAIPMMAIIAWYAVWPEW
jgi:hypothetical protein